MVCSLGLLVTPDVTHCVSERKIEGHEADGLAVLPAAPAGAQATSPIPITA